MNTPFKQYPGSASQQVTTFASELEAMTKRNPLGAGRRRYNIAGVLIGVSSCGRGLWPTATALAATEFPLL
jgi:hypothetical protein